jgi:CheY-like chemotaxis protein
MDSLGDDMPDPKLPSVLCVDDDRDIAEIVQAVLTDEGYAVSCLYDVTDNALLRTVGRLEPDCILLDSSSSLEYGDSWAAAAAIHNRHRPVSVIMFTAHSRDVTEGGEAATDRARAAGFVATIGKPFDLDVLVTAVATAVGRSAPFDRTGRGEHRRTEELVHALEARGAAGIRPSTMREWAMFRNRQGNLFQVYWWQQRGVYQVGRYEPDGQMVMLGQFVDRDAALEIALPS